MEIGDRRLHVKANLQFSKEEDGDECFFFKSWTKNSKRKADENNLTVESYYLRPRQLVELQSAECKFFLIEGP
jgi:hypothetical protein